MIKWILLLFFPLLTLKGEENLNSLHQQAEALWEAHDYAAASKIYEQLLSLSLPAWQNARVLYNLGTISLAQHQTVEAIAFFKKIHPLDLSLPRFGRDLFLNEGIAYLQYAQTLALTYPSSFDLQALFIKQSLQAFDQAHQLDCQIQEEEQKESPFSCHPSPLVDQWQKAARLQLQAMHQQKRQQGTDKEAKSTPAVILQHAIEQANRALLLFLLSEMMPAESAKEASTPSTLKHQQHDVLLQAAAFIPAVINEQTNRFQHAKNPADRCQQSPWDQVIPLFDRGYRAAQNADKQFTAASLDPQVLIANQEQTIKNWQQALNLILHPPQQNQAPSSASAPQNLTETFRLIQEMYLEDQTQPEQKSEELHSW